MSWTAATDAGGAGILRYDVYRLGTPNVLAGSVTTTSFIDASISLEGTYQYFVTAVDKAGNAGPPTAVKGITYDITAPTVPTGLVASASPTNAKPALAFTAATDTGGTGVVSYRLYRNGTSVATAAGTTVTDSALATDGTYTYTVTALDAAGNESAVSAAVTVVYDKTEPPTPRGARRGRDADEREAGADLDVRRRRRAVGLRALRRVPRHDARGQHHRQHVHRLGAVDVGLVQLHRQDRRQRGQRLERVRREGRRLRRDRPAGAGRIRGAGCDQGEADADVHRRQRHRRRRHRPLRRVPGRGPARHRRFTTSYTETSTTYPDGSYSYTVSAVDKAGNEGPQTTPKIVVYDTVAPIDPATPTTSAAVTKVKPAISWVATTDPGGSGVASYTVYRDGAQIAAAAVGTSYQDTALSTNGTYSYAIRANDAAGNTSGITATVAVTYDTVAPPVPVGLTGPTPTGANPALTWTSGGPDTLSGLRPLRDPARRHHHRHEPDGVVHAHGRLRRARTSTP